MTRRTSIDESNPQHRAWIKEFNEPLVTMYRAYAAREKSSRAIGVRWMAYVFDSHEKLLGTIQEKMKKADATMPACAKGCAHCCYMAVDVLDVEVPIAVDYIATNEPDRLDEIEERLEAQIAVKRRHPGDDDASQDRYVHELVPCAFLRDDASCAIYPVRPIACRAHHSLDAARCELGLTEPGIKAFHNSMWLRVTDAFGIAFTGAYLFCTASGKLQRKRRKQRRITPWQQRFFPKLFLDELRRVRKGGAR